MRCLLLETTIMHRTPSANDGEPVDMPFGIPMRTPYQMTHDMPHGLPLQSFSLAGIDAAVRRAGEPTSRLARQVGYTALVMTSVPEAIDQLDSLRERLHGASERLSWLRSYL